MGERLDLFCITSEGRSREMGRFQLKVKNFLTIRIVPLWIQLPLKVGSSLSLETHIQKLSLGGVAEGSQAVTFVGPDNSGRLMIL